MYYSLGSVGKINQFFCGIVVVCSQNFAYRNGMTLLLWSKIQYHLFAVSASMQSSKFDVFVPCKTYPGFYIFSPPTFHVFFLTKASIKRNFKCRVSFSARHLSYHDIVHLLASTLLPCSENVVWLEAWRTSFFLRRCRFPLHQSCYHDRISCSQSRPLFSS